VAIQEEKGGGGPAKVMVRQAVKAPLVRRDWTPGRRRGKKKSGLGRVGPKAGDGQTAQR